MKRKIFEVKLNGELVATKHAFNTARRAIVDAIRSVAKPGEVWERHTEEQTFEGVYRIGTRQRWKETGTGAEILATVELKG